MSGSQTPRSLDGSSERVPRFGGTRFFTKTLFSKVEGAESVSILLSHVVGISRLTVELFLTAAIGLFAVFPRGRA